MKISSRQRGLFFPMRDRAWLVHCRDHGIDSSDKQAAKAWHAQMLRDCAGVSSAADLDATEGFEAAMAAYEAVIGDDFTWQIKASEGILRRLQFSLKRPDLTQAYVAGIAAKMFGVDARSSLSVLSRDQVRAVRISLTYDRNRSKTCVVTGS